MCAENINIINLKSNNYLKLKVISVGSEGSILSIGHLQLVA